MLAPRLPPPPACCPPATRLDACECECECDCDCECPSARLGSVGLLDLLLDRLLTGGLLGLLGGVVPDPLSLVDPGSGGGAFG